MNSIYDVDGMLFNWRNDRDRAVIRHIAKENNYKYPPDMTGHFVVDVGANIGSAAILAGLRGATVYAIEPEIDNFTLLTENIKLNKLENNVTCFNVGIGNTGPAKLYVNRERPDWSSLYPDMNDLGTDNFEMIKLVTLKSFFDDNKIDHCTYLKLDAEGAEYTIIDEIEQGLHEKIDRIACEIHDGVLNHLEILGRLKEFYNVVTKIGEWEYSLAHK